MARSRVQEGDTSKSRVVFADDIAPELKKVQQGKLDWYSHLFQSKQFELKVESNK
jgi:hypothetical protein